MGANLIRRKTSDEIGGWSRLREAGSSGFSRSRSLQAPRTYRQQLTAELVEIGQGKHGLRPCQVLGQAAVPHFGEAPQLLDHPKRMLAAGARARTRPIDQAPAFAQRPAIGAPIDPVAHTARGERLAVGFLPVSL